MKKLGFVGMEMISAEMVKHNLAKILDSAVVETRTVGQNLFAMYAYGMLPEEWIVESIGESEKIFGDDEQYQRMKSLYEKSFTNA